MPIQKSERCLEIAHSMLRTRPGLREVPNILVYKTGMPATGLLVIEAIILPLATAITRSLHEDESAYHPCGLQGSLVCMRMKALPRVNASNKHCAMNIAF